MFVILLHVLWRAAQNRGRRSQTKSGPKPPWRIAKEKPGASFRQRPVLK